MMELPPEEERAPQSTVDIRECELDGAPKTLHHGWQ